MKSLLSASKLPLPMKVIELKDEMLSFVWKVLHIVFFRIRLLYVF